MTKPITFLLQTMLLLLIAAVILTAISTWQVYRYAATAFEQPQSADAAVILGAAAWGNKPSPVFRERIKHGIKLYQNGTVSKLIFTGGTPKAGYPTEAEVGKQFAIKHGIPESDIFTEHSSTNTYDNLKNTRTLMHQHKITSIIIVSDPLHMARASAMADDLGLNASYSATPTSRYTESPQKNHFFIREIFFLSIFRSWQLFKWLYGHPELEVKYS